MLRQRRGAGWRHHIGSYSSNTNTNILTGIHIMHYGAGLAAGGNDKNCTDYGVKDYKITFSG